MSRTVKEATVKCLRYDSQGHLDAFVSAYNVTLRTWQNVGRISEA